MTEASIWFDQAVEASDEGRLDAAETAYRTALELDPVHAEAHFGLGLTLMAARRFDEAVEPLQRAFATPQAPALWGVCLGQALYMTGRFGESAIAFEAAGRIEALPVNAHLTWARARTLARLTEGDAATAFDAYPALAGEHAEDVVVVAREAFAVLGVFGRLEAARATGRWLLARDPSDTVLAYGLRALEAQAMDRAPAEYVEALFDDFADRFDHQLVDLLDYRAPEWMAEMVGVHAEQFADVLDLGCGTGLSAAPLSRFGGRLTGVDLSSAMLAKARDRGAYQDLVKADLLAFLPNRRQAFDLIFAADVLIYFGDLSPVFAGVAQALRPGGIFAFSTELGDQDWTMLSSGRFSHAQTYVERLSEPAFERLSDRIVPLRREGRASAPGLLQVLRRR